MVYCPRLLKIKKEIMKINLDTSPDPRVFHENLRDLFLLWRIRETRYSSYNYSYNETRWCF